MKRPSEEWTTQQLVRRALQGDQSAFDVLWPRYQRRITVFLWGWTHDWEVASDLAQVTAIKAWLALSRRCYREQGAFAAWLHSIARNEAKAWIVRQGRQPATAAFTEVEDLGRRGPRASDRPDLHMLFEWLTQQLDQILLGPAPGQPGAEPNLNGQLKKLAFVLYYVDGCTLPEIESLLAHYAEQMGAVGPTDTQLNNWLRRGDILAALMRHLVDQHIEVVRDLIEHACGGLELTDQQRDLARLHWQKGRSPTAISEDLGLPEDKVEAELEAIRRKVLERMTAQMKQRLHDLRHQR